jgi:lipopolysaccharide transport system ATP-binding protein
MSNIAISVESVSKLYRLGEINTRTFYGDFRNWWSRRRRLPGGIPIETTHHDQDANILWALRNVSFSVSHGEAIGIMGRNGAGKSTLLKILSRVTAPTLGAVKIKGRIASLLEVGTGFHPELTGRENVFLNSALLGMNRDETQRKFDEIVNFSGLEKFIDTPVKHYSSGMYVRLAFSVSAHLEPEILVLDEVLAVGDLEFQKKSLRKMQSIADTGCTVLFVSHAMNMISLFCSRSIILNKGCIEFDGETADAAKLYYSSDGSSVIPYQIDYTKRDRRVGDDYATLLEAHVEDDDGRLTGEMNINAGFKVKMRYQLHGAVAKSCYPNFHFYNSLYQCVFVTPGERNLHVSGNAVYEATCHVPGSFLNDDVYYIGLALTFTREDFHASFFEQNALSVVIRDPVLETVDQERQGYVGAYPGAVRPKLEWNIRIVE